MGECNEPILPLTISLARSRIASAMQASAKMKNTSSCAQQLAGFISPNPNQQDGRVQRANLASNNFFSAQLH